MGEHPHRVPRDAYAEDLAEIVRADDLGWAEAWIGEHHLNGKMEVLPSPEMLIAKATPLTKHIRMGPGVRLIALHYPLELAAEAATADHLTDGRYNCGYGSGTVLDFDFYGHSYDEANARVEEALDIVLEAWRSNQPFSFEGKSWSFRDKYIWPLPLQQPHPPMARACASPASFYATGKRGFGVLASQWQRASAIAANWAEYERGAQESGLKPDRGLLRVGRFCWVGQTDGGARDQIRDWCNASLDYLRTYQPTVRRALEALKPSPDATVEDVTFDYLCDIGQLIVGSPDTVAANLRSLREQTGGFNTLLLTMGRDPAPIADRLEMLDRFATHVAPSLASGMTGRSR